MPTFDYPILLHCSQTRYAVSRPSWSLITLFFYTALKRHNTLTSVFYKFDYPILLHCSQTPLSKFCTASAFDYPILLHCSQTTTSVCTRMPGLITLFFYTALKHDKWAKEYEERLITLFFYTALKRVARCRFKLIRLITLFFYTALKR